MYSWPSNPGHEHVIEHARYPTRRV